MLGDLFQTFGFRQLLSNDCDDPHISGEGLKNVRGDGVFFWITHGGTLDPAGNIIQGLMMVTDAKQQAVEPTYADEFAQGTLIYGTGPLCTHPTACGSRTHDTRLAITPQWIRKYEGSFDPHSVVFVDPQRTHAGRRHVRHPRGHCGDRRRHGWPPLPVCAGDVRQ